MNFSPDGSPWRGVTTSSWPFRRYAARLPFTSTRLIFGPEKSRLKRDRFLVAVAVIVVVALMWRVFGVNLSLIV